MVVIHHLTFICLFSSLLHLALCLRTMGSQIVLKLASRCMRSASDVRASPSLIIDPTIGPWS